MSGCSRYAQAVCELNFKQVWISFDNRFRLAFALLIISVPWRPKGRRRAHAVRCKHVGIHEFWIGKRSTSMTRVKQEHNRKHTENAIGCYLATGRLTVLQTVQLITCYENISGVAFCCCFCSHSSMALLYIYIIYPSLALAARLSRLSFCGLCWPSDYTRWIPLVVKLWGWRQIASRGLQSPTSVA